MARNTSVSLGDHFAGFIDQKVKEGRYGSASDMIRAGLRLLEEEEAKLERLRALIAEGDASAIVPTAGGGNMVVFREDTEAMTVVRVV